MPTIVPTIAISQRVDTASQQDWLSKDWDAYMAATFTPVELFRIPNTGSLNPNTMAHVSAIILSGGNDIGECPHRDDTEAALIQHAIEHHLPLVGICRGAQFIYHHCGGLLQRVNSAEHAGTTHPVHIQPHATFRNPEPDLIVNSYHHWGIAAQHFPEALTPIATDKDGCIEAFAHNTHPWLALMWHPERPNPEPATRLNAQWLSQALKLNSQKQPLY